MSFVNTIWRRLFLLIFVVFGVTVITFIISHMIPGDPARLMAGERATLEVVENMRRQLGLDLPLYQQYLRYVGDLLHGDLGQSIRTRRPVTTDLAAFFPATIELALVALSFSILLGVPLGVLSAVYKDRPIDHVARTFSVIGISTPTFWLGLVLILVFYGNLGLLPGSGRIGIEFSDFEHITGFYLIDTILSGNRTALFSVLEHLLMPAFVLGFSHLGVVSRQIRSSMLETLHEDYTRTAKASGLPRLAVILNALRSALIPSVTMIGLAFGDLLYGAVITETVFGWPGMGSYVVESIQALDFPAIMGFTIVASAIYVVINLLIDLTYMALDPQVREVG